MPITPKQFFIVPDPKIRTATTLVEGVYPKQGGRFIGTGLSNNNNNGFLQVFGTGDPTDDLDIDIHIVSGGNVNNATYVYREQGGDNNSWFGQDDIRCIKDVHCPFSDQTRKGIGATAFVAPLSNREVVCIGSNQAKNKIRLAYRTISSASARYGGGGWTEIDLDLKTLFDRGIDYTGYSASTGCNIDATVMDDGLVIISVKNQGDIDIYTTKDGITWSIRTKAIISNYLGQDPFPNTGDLPTTYGRLGNVYNIKIASSGEFLRIAYAGSNSSDDAFFVKVISSTDRGSTWRLIEDNIQIDAGQQVGANRFNLDLVGLKNGQFMLSVPDQHYMLFRFYKAQGSGTFGYISSLYIYWSFSTGPNQSPRGYFCISDEWLWFFVDGDLYTASRAITNSLHTDVNQEMNIFFMPLFENLSEGSVWYNLGQKKEVLTSGVTTRHNDGITGFRGLGRYNLARGKLYNRGDSICFFGGLYDNQYFPSESLIGPVYFRFGGWNKCSLNTNTVMEAKQNTSEYNFALRKKPVDSYINYGRFYNYVEWHACFGALAGTLYTSETSPWTEVRSGATRNLDINRMRLTGYSTSDSLYYTFLDQTYYNNDSQSLEVSPLYNLAFAPRLVGSYKWQGTSYGYPMGDRNGSCITWTCKVLSGGETGNNATRTTPTGAGIRIISYVSSAASYKGEDETICLLISMKNDTNDTIEIFDVNAQSVLTTVTSLTFAGYMEFRLGLRPKKTNGTPVVAGNSVEAILCYRVEGNSAWGSTNVLQVNTTPNLDFLIGSEPRQEVSFGLFSQTGSGAVCQVSWKNFKIHTSSSLGIFNSANGSTLLPNCLRGKRTSSLSHYVNDGVSVLWGGSGGAENDVFDLTVEHSYASFNSTKYDSPRIRWSSGDVTTSNLTTLQATGGSGKDGFFHNALAVFGTNAKSVQVLYGYNGTTYTNTQTLSLFRAKGRITDSSENGVKVSWDSPAPVTAIFSSSVANRKYFAHFSNVQNSSVEDPTSYLIDRHYKDNSSNHWLEMVGVTMSFADPSLVGTTLEVYADRGWIVYAPAYGENRVKINVLGSSWNPYEKDNTKQDLYVGSIIVGTTLDLDPLEMSWEYNDTESANTTVNNTRSGLTWGYREGPTVRTVTGSFQGDVTKQVRRYLRDTMRAVTNFNETGFVFVGYDVVPSTDPQSDDYFLQGRFQEQLAFENVGWYYDENTQKWNPVGNISLTITEIV